MTEPVVTPVPGKLDALTGVRIVAALWVLSLHLSDVTFSLVPGLAFLQPLFSRGGLGVDLFFALSGFILSYNYLERLGTGLSAREYFRFLRLRLARIYPVHFVTLNSFALLSLIATAVGVGFNESIRTSPVSYLENLLLIQTWFGQVYSWNGVAWSVSAEWFAYLLFPFAALLLVRVRSIFTATVAAAVTAGLFIAFSIFLDDSSDSGAPDFSLLRISASFLVGAFMYQIYKSWKWGAGVWAWATPAAIVALVSLAYVPAVPDALLMPLLYVIVLGLAFGRGAISALLSTRPLVFGGLISYSFYMVHAQVLAVIRALVVPRIDGFAWPIGLAVVFGTVLLVGIAATLLFKFVEEPMRKVLRGRAQAAPKATREKTLI